LSAASSAWYSAIAVLRSLLELIAAFFGTAAPSGFISESSLARERCEVLALFAIFLSFVAASLPPASAKNAHDSAISAEPAIP
jgi:hypothetical protein